MGDVVEEERKFLGELFDQAMDEDLDILERHAAVTQLGVRLRYYLTDVTPFSRVASEIHGDPKKGVVTPLE